MLPLHCPSWLSGNQRWIVGSRRDTSRLPHDEAERKNLHRQKGFEEPQAQEVLHRQYFRPSSYRLDDDHVATLRGAAKGEDC